MSKRAKKRRGQPRGWWRRFGVFVVRFLVLGALLVAAGGYAYGALVLHVNPPVVGVQGTSMEPTFRSGELVILAPVHTNTLKRGDVIAIRVPRSDRVTDNLPATIVHRIVSVEHSANGLVFVTKGDHRSGNDVFTTEASNVVGRVKFAVPELGYALVFIQGVEGEIFLGAAVIIGLLYFFFAVIDAKRRRIRDVVSIAPATTDEVPAQHLAARIVAVPETIDVKATLHHSTVSERARATFEVPSVAAPQPVSVSRATFAVAGETDAALASAVLMGEMTAIPSKKQRDRTGRKGEKKKKKGSKKK